ncbi:MAG: hypothetical protein AAF449_12575 [Myxococcota bacterium]
MATTPKLAALQPRAQRNQTEGPKATKAGRTAATSEGTSVDVRAGLPPIYRDSGHKEGRGQGQGGGSNTQLAQAAIRSGGSTGLFPAQRTTDRTLFNNTSPASYHEASVEAARWVPASATERYRPRWMEKYSSLGGGRRITFATEAFNAGRPELAAKGNYDIPSDWTSQLADGMTEARVNDVTDGRPMPHRTAVYNLVGGIVRA